jgi:hypothetical protein
VPDVRYVETLHFVVRQAEHGVDLPSEALVGAFDVGEDVPLDEIFDKLHDWFVRENYEPFAVETRRSVAEVGATGIGTELVLTFLGAAGGVALNEAWQYVKTLLPRGDESVRSEFRWLREAVEPDERPQYLAESLARALEARSAELRLLDYSEAENEFRATFETSTGERYVVRATDELYRIERAES